ncbi:hypothetical protein FQZ97_1065790 [compost metagenome]
MGIGAVAGDHGRIVNQRSAEVGVEIQRYRDRHLGRGGTDACQQFAFGIRIALGHHGAVQVQHHGIAARAHRLDNAGRHRLECLCGHHATGHRVRHQGHHELVALAAYQVDERGRGAVGALARTHRVVAVERASGAAAVERAQWRGNRRKGIGFMPHQGNDKTHGLAPTA